MRLGVVNIDNKRHIALFNGNKIALADNFGVKKQAIKDLDREDFKKIENINEFESYDYSFESAVDKSSNIICIGLNYKTHIDETGEKLLEDPVLFLKSNNSLTGNNSRVRILKNMNVDYEGELGVMIGKKARDVSKRDALDHVFGYFIANDVSSRKMQFLNGQWFIGKSFDGFFPNGPYIVTADEIPDPQDLRIQTYLNTDLRQNSSTDYMIHPVDELISYISKYITLMPGDVISTGTPSGVILGMPEDKRIWIKPGDNVTVKIDKIGELKNTFVE